MRMKLNAPKAADPAGFFPHAVIPLPSGSHPPDLKQNAAVNPEVSLSFNMRDVS